LNFYAIGCIFNEQLVCSADSSWSSAGEGYTRGVAASQNWPSQQEAARRKGHAAATLLASLLGRLSCSFVFSIVVHVTLMAKASQLMKVAK
jgi:hypothetical protein